MCISIFILKCDEGGGTREKMMRVQGAGMQKESLAIARRLL